MEVYNCVFCDRIRVFQWSIAAAMIVQSTSRAGKNCASMEQCKISLPRWIFFRFTSEKETSSGTVLFSKQHVQVRLA